MGKVMWSQGQVYTVDPAADLDTLLAEQMAWEQINSHFAADLAGIYHKMGLNGFKRMKRYQSIKENKESAELRHYIIDYLGVLPTEEFAYVSPTLVASLKDGLNLDHTLCSENIVRLNRIMELALSGNSYSVIPMVDCLIKKENERLVKIQREYIEGEFVGWDNTYMMMHDKALHKMYKCKEKKAYSWKK